MGMYTELVLRCEIKSDAPDNVKNLIHNMVDGGDRETDLNAVELFGERGDWFLRSSSFYHHPVSYAGFDTSCDFTGPQLFVRCDCKNYDNEIERFVEWLTLYIDEVDDEFLGYSRYEEDDKPTLLFHPNRWERVKP